MNELMKMSSLLCDLDGICGYEDKVRQHIEKEVSPYPNQINNVLVFFGIFRGTFDVHASNTNEEMKAIAEGRLAGLADDDLSENYITL